MARIDYRICDRCNAKLSEQNRESRVPAYQRRKILWFLGPVTHSHTVEMCKKCTEGLDKYLKGTELK